MSRLGRPLRLTSFKCLGFCVVFSTVTRRSDATTVLVWSDEWLMVNGLKWSLAPTVAAEGRGIETSRPASAPFACAMK